MDNTSGADFGGPCDSGRKKKALFVLQKYYRELLDVQATLNKEIVLAD